MVLGGLWPPGLENAPWQAWIGGPIGVLFIAAASWLVARIGAATTALLVIGGQMVTGVALDLITGAPGSGNEGTSITLGSQVTDAGSADTFTYAWSVTKDGNAFTLPNGTNTSAARSRSRRRTTATMS